MRTSFIFLLSISSCSPPDYHKTVIGNWYNCDDGTYSEMYFNNEHATSLSLTSPDRAIGSNTIWKYEIKGDTIFYGNSRPNRGRIKIISNDHIQMNAYIEDKKEETEFLDWYRLTEKPESVDVLSLNDHTVRVKLKEEFLKRASARNCSK